MSVFCPECGSVVADYFPARLPEGTKRLKDIGYTLDGKLLCRTRFKEFCQATSIEAAFQTLPGGTDSIYMVLPTKTIQFDPTALPTRFIHKCSTCGQFKEVIGSIPPAFTGNSVTNMSGIARSDLEFGSSRDKAPILIADKETAARLHEQRFLGLTLVSI